MTEQSNHQVQVDTSIEISSEKIHKWEVVTFLLLIFAFIIPKWIYLTGNLQDAFGPFVYSMADLLFGPIWAVSLVTIILSLRKYIGKHAPMRMSIALMVAFLAAGMMVLAACIRSSNRNYHLTHPELHLEESTTILTVWTTIVQGVIATGWHFLGWALIMIASSGWTSNRLPKVLCIIYWCAGITALFVYVFPILEGFAIALSIVWATWQGILFWKEISEETDLPEEILNQNE